MSQQPPQQSSQSGFGGSSGQTSQQGPSGSMGRQGRSLSTGQTGQSGQPMAAGRSGISGSQGQMGQQTGQVPPGTAAVATAIAEAIEVCGYCADQCIREANPNMVECIRLCEDVTELGEAALALVSRDSRYAGSVLQTFQQAARACAQECSRHQAGHCQTCASVLGQTVQTTEQYAGGQQF